MHKLLHMFACGATNIKWNVFRFWNDAEFDFHDGSIIIYAELHVLGKLFCYWCGRWPNQIKNIIRIELQCSSSSLSIGSAAKGDYDPTSFTLEGLNPNTNIYQPIISSKSFNQEWVDRIPQRNTPNIQINSSYDSGDSNLIYTEVTFDNLELYNSYRLMFPSTRVYPNSDNDSTYAVEVGGVELVGEMIAENVDDEPTLVRFLLLFFVHIICTNSLY